MSWLGRGLGNAGSQIAIGSDMAEQLRMRKQKFDADQAMQKLQQSMMPLQIQEIQQRIKDQQQSAQMKTPEGIRTYLKGILGRDPTEAEISQYAGVSQPTQPKEDKQIHAYVNDKGKQMVIFMRPDSSTYEKEFQDVKEKETAEPKLTLEEQYDKAIREKDPKRAKEILQEMRTVADARKDPSGKPKPITPQELNTQLNSTQTQLRQQFSQADARLRQVQSANLKRSGSLWSKATTSAEDISEPQKERDNLFKAITYIEGHRAAVLAGKEAIEDVVGTALQLQSGDEVTSFKPLGK